MQITDEMFYNIRRYCSDELISHAFLNEVVDLNPLVNRWDITLFVMNDRDNLTIVDKMNVVSTFLECGGTIDYNGQSYRRLYKSYLMSELIHNGIITQRQESDILMPWIDCTDGEPSFDLEIHN